MSPHTHVSALEPLLNQGASRTFICCFAIAVLSEFVAGIEIAERDVGDTRKVSPCVVVIALCVVRSYAHARMRGGVGAVNYVHIFVKDVAHPSVWIVSHLCLDVNSAERRVQECYVFVGDVLYATSTQPTNIDAHPSEDSDALHQNISCAVGGSLLPPAGLHHHGVISVLDEDIVDVKAV